MSTVELRFAALPGHVRTARMIATAVSRRAGVPTGAIDEIRLAVGEACARAVSVNSRRAPKDLVHVQLTHTPECFIVAVTDSGAPGDDVVPGPDGGLLGASALLDLATRKPDAQAPDASAAMLAAIVGATDAPTDEAGTGGGPDLDEMTDAEVFDAAGGDDAGSPLPPGLGLALIEGLVDDVEIRNRTDGVGTVVTMTWHTGALVADQVAAVL
jgi:anti-sigma regulatory factor (Ser/Thr protein kinase)